jgi:hypothetical protein
MGILGDNDSALQNALTLSGRGPLHSVAREIAWRQAAFKWVFTVAHLPTESNTTADALSRMHAPESARLPTRLKHVPQIEPPSVAQLWQAV